MSSIKSSIAICAFLLFSGMGGYAEASIVNTKANDYLVTKWTTEQGLPQNSVTSIVQTKDGYIWVGTFGGLARFDGVRFVTFDAVNTPIFNSSRIISLHEDPLGRLWIGAENGDIYYLDNGEFGVFSLGNSKRGNVWGIVADSDRAIYFSSDIGLERFLIGKDGTPDPNSRLLLSGERNFGLFKHPDGTIWTRSQGIIFQVVEDGVLHHSERYPSLGNNVVKINFDSAGRMIVAEPDMLSICSSERCDKVFPMIEDRQGVGFSLASRSETAFLQQANELIEVSGNVAKRFDLSGVMRGGSRSMMFDADGNLWIGSQEDGLVRLTRRSVGLFSDLLGNEIDNVYSVFGEPNGTVWVGARRLYRIIGGNVTTFSKTARGPFPVVRSIGTDCQQNLWVGGTVGLYRMKEGLLDPIPGFEQEPLHAIFFDSRCNLWIGGSNGLWKYSNGVATQFSSSDILTANSVHAIFESRDGSIWVGTMGGVSRIKDGHVTKYTPEEGLSGAFVRDIFEDSAGGMWFATYGAGLSRLKNERFSRVTQVNGLPNNFVSRVIMGPDGRTWILSNIGIFVARFDDLDRVADGKAFLISGTSYGKADGMPSSEANGAHQYAGYLAADGRFWFPMLRDVVIIDPSTQSSSAASVFIETATSTAGSKHSELIKWPTKDPGVLVISPDSRNIEIEYTGLSFKKPEQISFRYRMIGMDPNWVNADKRRTAFFPYLPPGSYTFEVMAISPDGIPSGGPATVRIEVPGRFWESIWFVILVACLAVLIIYLVFRMRFSQLAEKERLQAEFSGALINAQEKERMRIAEDLHDGLGQQLLLIQNWTALAQNPELPNEKQAAYLEEISLSTADALAETRSAVQALAPQNLERFGLTETIISMVDQMANASGIRIEKEVEDIDAIVPKRDQLGVFRIVQECLTNVVKHSKASKASVTVSRSQTKLFIEVEDNGIGLSSEPGSKVGGGFGLQGIRERLRLLNGRIEIVSSPSSGTKIRILIEYEANNEDPNS